eukprot:scaffold5011_cov255-Pinguiococcus_pyrenoidosus.AAC.4
MRHAARPRLPPLHGQIVLEGVQVRFAKLVPGGEAGQLILPRMLLHSDPARSENSDALRTAMKTIGILRDEIGKQSSLHVCGIHPCLSDVFRNCFLSVPLF